LSGRPSNKTGALAPLSLAPPSHHVKHPRNDHTTYDHSKKRIDAGAIGQAMMALLWLDFTATGTIRKSLDGAAIERPNANGLISDPVGKACAVEMIPKAQEG
jgi:hypothetical protein